MDARRRMNTVNASLCCANYVYRSERWSEFVRVTYEILMRRLPKAHSFLCAATFAIGLPNRLSLQIPFEHKCSEMSQNRLIPADTVTLRLVNLVTCCTNFLTFNTRTTSHVSPRLRTWPLRCVMGVFLNFCDMMRQATPLKKILPRASLPRL